MTKKFIKPVPMLIAGLVVGIVIRLLDIYTSVLGPMFSQAAVWMLICTVISVYSETKWKAMINVLFFCLAMLTTYYAMAVLTHGVYGKAYIIGWTVFAFATPVMAYFAWLTKENGVLPKIISACIVIGAFFSSVIFFHGPKFYDYIIDAVLIWFLFFKKVDRAKA